MVEPLFTKSAIDKLRPTIQKMVDELLDKLESHGCKEGPVDLVTWFCLPVPSYVSICTPHIAKINSRK